MLIEVIACEGWNEMSGPSLLRPSGTMGQGVLESGDLAKGLNPVTVEKSNLPQPSGEGSAS